MAGSLIDSEHVVEVVAAGIDPSLRNMPWIAMEYLEGEDLGSHLGRIPDHCLESGHAHMVLEQIFHAIIAAHRAGVVHRDLKPANVFLARSKRVREPFVVKVLDFGIAKMLSDTHVASRTGQLGTPGWMAPEQLEPGQISPAADVWALGLLAFFTLTGVRYWVRENDPNASVVMLITEMVTSQIVAASERAEILGCADLIPTGFDAWFARCVHRDVEARYPNAQAAWEPLSLLLDKAPSRTSHSLSAEGGPGPQQPTQPTTIHVNAVEPAPPLPNKEIVPMVAHADSLYQGIERAWAPRVAPSSGAGHSADTPRRSRKSLLIAVAGIGALSSAGLAIAGAVAFSRDGDQTAAAIGLPLPDSHSTSPAVSSAPTPSQSPMLAIAGGAATIEGKSIRVRGFELDATEVTVAAYEACTSAAECSADVNTVNVAGAEAWSALCNWSRRTERAEHPMNCASFDQATAYCRFVGKRLPTDEEWVYAAYFDGGERTQPWGTGMPASGKINLCGSECAAMLRSLRFVPDMKPIGPGYADPYGDTSPAAAMSEDRSPSGVVGLGGNVMEWTSTPWGKGAMRCRGGSWLTDSPRDTSVNAAYSVAPGERRANLGFRCAR